MACIRPCPRIGLSTYIVCRDGRVEAGEPHVADDDDLERVLRILESLGERLAARLVADVALPVERVRRRAGHHDLDCAGRVVVAVPLGPQRVMAL